MSECCDAAQRLATAAAGVRAMCRVHWREMHHWRRLYRDPYKPPDIRNLAHAQAVGHEITLRGLLSTRRALRGAA